MDITEHLFLYANPFFLIDENPNSVVPVYFPSTTMLIGISVFPDLAGNLSCDNPCIPWQPSPDMSFSLMGFSRGGQNWKTERERQRQRKRESERED